MQFLPIEQLPLDLFPGFQADGGRQGQGEAHVEPGVLSTRSDGLHAQRIGSLHLFGG